MAQNRMIEDEGGGERRRELQTDEVCSVVRAVFIPVSSARAHAKGSAKTPLLCWQGTMGSRRQGAKSVRADWWRVPSPLFPLFPLFRRRGTSLFATLASDVIDPRLGRTSPPRPSSVYSSEPPGRNHSEQHRARSRKFCVFQTFRPCIP